MTEYPKVLVISTNCFSKFNSNGRTLSGFFKNWPKDNLAQLYLYEGQPDFDICSNYYRITNMDALKSFFFLNEKSGIVNNVNKIESSASVQSPKRIAKNSLRCLIRDIVWNAERWKVDKCYQWVAEFAPDIIFFQATGAEYSTRIVNKISEKFKVPLIVFNTEMYYFNEKCYLPSSRWFNDFWYSIYRDNFRHEYDKLMNTAIYALYSNDLLKDLYDKQFGVSSATIYTTSDIIPSTKIDKGLSESIVYLGNLGLNRHKALIEIAEALKSMNCNYVLDVYGSAPNKIVENELKKTKAIKFHGFVQYEDVVKIMQNATLVIHAEEISENTVRNIKGAFSTKIADALACGTCFFLYAPKDLACTQYLIKNKCACVVTDKEMLMPTLSSILNDKSLRSSYVNVAVKIAKQNHNLLTNGEIIRELLANIVEGHSENLPD